MGSKSIPNSLRIPYALISDETPHRRSVRVVFLFVFPVFQFAQNNKEKLTRKEDKEFKEPDYNEYEVGDQLKEKQEEGTGEMETINQVF